MRVIQVSDLIDMLLIANCQLLIADWPHLPAEEGEEEREKDTHHDRRRQRKVEAEAAASHVDISWQTAKRQTDDDEQAEGGDAETEEDQCSTHQRPQKS